MKRFSKAAIALSSASLFLGSQILLPPQSAQAQTPIGQTGCPAGTTESSRNFVVNGNFSTSPGVVNGPLPAVNPAAFTSTLPYRGDGVYPDDGPPAPVPLGGLSIQSGNITYLGGVVQGRPFPGDGTVPPSNTYLYSNPNAAATNPRAEGSAFPNPIIWQQRVAGLSPNTTYNFRAYFYNLLQPNGGAADPVITLNVAAVGGAATTVGAPITVGNGTAQPGIPANQNTRQNWIPVQLSFTTGAATSVDLSIVDSANTVLGDDFGFTAVALSQCTPRLGVAKQAGTPTRNANGSYTVPYTIRATNLASVAGAQYALTDLRLQENLANTFTGATFNGVNNVQSPTLSINPNFNGTTNTELLQNPSTLQPGETAIVTFNAIVTPGTGPNGFGPFNNQVRATATAQDGTPVSDDSTDGANVDPNGDRIPSENTPTPVTLPQGSQVGIAKQAGTPVNNGDGSFTVPYTLLIRNTGATILNNVQVVENLTPAFAQATSFSVVPNSVSGNGVTVNQNFNGTSDTNLLAPGNTLALNQSSTINFSVRVVPGSNLGPYNNTASVTGTGPNGAPVSDDSQDGTNPDPDGNGNPGDNSTPTTVNFGAGGSPGFRLVKRITSASQGTGTPGATFNSFIDGPGDDDNAPGFAQLQPQAGPVGVINVDPRAALQSGNDVEYTIYFLSDGTAPALNVNLCDPIPTGTSFIANSNQVRRNNGSIASGGTFFSPLAPLPPGNSCPDQTNPNGAIIFDLGNVSNLPGNNFGFVRFRVRVN